MTIIESSINHLLCELTDITKHAWKFTFNPEVGGVITQPNELSIEFQTLTEALSILSDILTVTRSGDMKWCLE